MPDPATNPASIQAKMPDPATNPARLKEFDLAGKIFIVTGGAQGLGLTLAQALVEAGGHVYCLDRATKPSDDFYKLSERLAAEYGGSLSYAHVDVREAFNLDNVIASIAAKHDRLDGLVAAAAIQKVVPALEYPPEAIPEMLAVNYTGVYLSAVSCARQMIKYKIPGSMLLVASMSGFVANKGFTSSVYNSSKAAVIQLTKNLAMEWGQIVDGKPIRVNALCPGNIMTPMVRKNFADDPQLKELWERENMMGRISEPEEYRGAALFALSSASSFMTGSKLVIDGGYSAW